MARTHLATVRYRVRAADVHAHLYAVELEIAAPQADQVVSLPVWIPGSYLVREFARHLQSLRARQGGRAVALRQLDKCSWQLACKSGQALVLRYEVYAYDNSVRTAWLDAQRGFFNPSSLCLRVHGQEDAPHALEVAAMEAGWSLATALAADKIDRHGFGRYLATDYDELVDSPVEMGIFWSGSFQAGGVPHRFVVAGAPPSFDGARLLADTQRICETAIRFWHPSGARSGRKPPHGHYLFMLNATDSGYGGLEHRASTALICARKDLPAQGGSTATMSEGYTTLLGLISHEYFHTWNVKRLRPAEFAHYDYSRENYTELLWFFEGFTSYYDDLLLRRAGLIDDASYLRLLNKTANQVLQTPGRKIQSVAQSSFDAWVKYYRQDENTPNATVSYYSKGALLALCLDLSLRAQGHGTLDEVMRSLWRRCAGGPMRENDLLAVLREVEAEELGRELLRWVHGTAELPLQALLEQHGVVVIAEPSQLAQQLGIRVEESPSLLIKTVLRGGAAERAGFAAGDEWLGLEVGSGKQRSAWRMRRLTDLPLYAGTQTRVRALVARDQRLLDLDLTIPRAGTTWRLAAGDTAALQRWLDA